MPTSSKYDDLPATKPFRLPGNIPLKMVLVKPGTFWMGDDSEEALDKEKPKHLVQITRPYYIGKYAVTQQQWTALMKSNPSTFKGDRRPVEQVRWNDIVTGGQEDGPTTGFLTVLNEQIPTDGAFALPTEAQWEYAARGGHLFAVQNEETIYYPAFAGGDHLERAGWFRENAYRQSQKYGRKHANALGLYDMNGNLYEWCADWFEGAEYKKRKQDVIVDPTGPETGTDRTLRGGSWVGTARGCRPSFRDGLPPGSRYGDDGFRLVWLPRVRSSSS